MRVHLTIAVVVIGMAFYLGLSAAELALLILTIGAVLAAEIFNTAIEAVVDLASTEKSEMGRIAKDSAAGAVLVMAIIAALTGLIVLGPPLLRELT